MPPPLAALPGPSCRDSTRCRMPLFAPGFKARPWWWEAAEPPQHDAPLPDRVGVAVVGGGYAGLSAALTLRRLGHEVAVLDAERIGWGASSRNGGMVSGGLKVAAIRRRRRGGRSRWRRRPASPSSRRPSRAKGSTATTSAAAASRPPGRRRTTRRMAARVDALAEITGMPAEMLPRERQREALGSDHYHGGMLLAATGSLHPGKYARGLAAAAEKAGATLVDGVRVQRHPRTKGAAASAGDRPGRAARRCGAGGDQRLLARPARHRDALAGAAPGAADELHHRHRGAGRRRRSTACSPAGA